MVTWFIALLASNSCIVNVTVLRKNESMIYKYNVYDNICLKYMIQQDKIGLIYYMKCW